mgnify:CR=1 FL=1|tara:strand:- start:1162 stop:1350 length:189 start_codon:yes stop_codon:yes gene_type:complete
MSYIKRAIEEIQERGWPVTNESLERLEKTIQKEFDMSFRELLDSKIRNNDKDGKVYKDGEIR